MYISYCRSPFKVLEKWTDVTYREECGNNGKSQVIHVDRMRKRNQQILEGETEQPSDSVPENCDELVQTESENPELVVESFIFEQSDLRNDNLNKGRRTRRPPVWMNAYCA